MGRRAKSPDALPRLRVRVRGGKRWYYYDLGGRPRVELPLGSDRALAVQRWAAHERDRGAAAIAAREITFRAVATRYRAEAIPRKAPRTQRDNHVELDKLLEFFDDPPAPLDAITPQHVRQYLRWRKDAATRANRERALLSHLWNWARAEGYTERANPCAGIRGHRERRRDTYIEDAQLAALRDAGDDTLRDAVDLLYLTGQRPSDVLKMRETDIRDGRLHVAQGKTGKRVRILVVGELAQVIERIRARKRGHRVYATALVVGPTGRPIQLRSLQGRFVRARDAAGLPKHLQLRDLRAKAGTDTMEATKDPRATQRQLGHAHLSTTEIYLRDRLGDEVKPTR